MRLEQWTRAIDVDQAKDIQESEWKTVTDDYSYKAR
ncbi:hypothetical protein CGRA01v4_08448 [Colletotrichum graminicola]|nr:hypothetical protein CGRA01v4_08448 [Colletotrichum graminicola]